MKFVEVFMVVTNAVCSQDGEFLCSWTEASAYTTEKDAWSRVLSDIHVNKDEDEIISSFYDEKTKSAFIRTENMEDSTIQTDYTVCVKGDIIVLP